MSRLLRTVFTWLLLLALPLQGLAAAAMMNCVPAAKAQTQLQAPSHAHDGEHADHAHHGHPAHHAAAADDTPAQPGHHGCSACAACCVALALPSRAPHLGDVPATPPPHAAAAPCRASFLTDGPERPPRTVLA